MSPRVRRVSLFAAAGAAGFVTFAAAAFAATETEDGDRKVERRVVIVQDGPDGREVRVEGPDGFTAELPDLAEFRDMAGEMMPMVRAFRSSMPMMMGPEERADHLREMLQLRPDQEAALQAFVATARQEPEFDPAGFEIDDDLTTPQRLERARARMAEHQAAFERRADAVTRFYGQLTPSQKKVFDKLPGADGLEAGHHFRMIRMDGDDDVKRFRFRTPKTPTTPETPKAPS